MAPTTIEKLTIRNFGCINQADFTLSPLHALIGPNDTGKSTVLRALRALAAAAILEPNDLRDPQSLPRDQRARATSPGGPLDIDRFLHAANKLHDAEIKATFGEHGVALKVRSGQSARMGTMTVYPQLLQAGSEVEVGLTQVPEARTKYAACFEPVAGAQLLRLDPDALRKPSKLIPDEKPVMLPSERGDGLPGVYDAIRNRSAKGFMEISDRLKTLFGQVEQLQLRNPTADQKMLAVKLKTGEEIKADQMSEGLLYYLAFAALPYLAKTALILIEEPENGLHPARIADVMRVLREVSKERQVILATHSPLVINELNGDEVTVLTRTEQGGTKATRLIDTPNFAERSKVYALGELWVSYADGAAEAPLLEGTGL